jgi:hypothetical protein
MRFRRIAVMVATVVLAALAVTAPASAAGLVTWEHHYQAGRGCLDHNFTQGVYNNHCLDNSHLGMRTVSCNGLPYQLWAPSWY